MTTHYTLEEDKELNKELKVLQSKAKKLILDSYYDSISLSDLQLSILTQLTNAEKHNDINPYLWNTGMIEKVLDIIVEKLKMIKQEK